VLAGRNPAIPLAGGEGPGEEEQERVGPHLLVVLGRGEGPGRCSPTASYGCQQWGTAMTALWWLWEAVAGPGRFGRRQGNSLWSQFWAEMGGGRVSMSGQRLVGVNGGGRRGMPQTKPDRAIYSQRRERMSKRRRRWAYRVLWAEDGSGGAFPVGGRRSWHVRPAWRPCGMPAGRGNGGGG
jgi:hypothetical protein